jgi:hypothetical protein
LIIRKRAAVSLNLVVVVPAVPVVAAAGE